MMIRFLATTESSVPGYPFEAGQQIAVDDLSREMQLALRDGHAVVVREEPEIAVAPGGERAVSFVMPVRKAPRRKVRA